MGKFKIYDAVTFTERHKIVEKTYSDLVFIRGIGWVHESELELVEEASVDFDRKMKTDWLYEKKEWPCEHISKHLEGYGDLILGGDIPGVFMFCRYCGASRPKEETLEDVIFNAYPKSSYAVVRAIREFAKRKGVEL